MKRFLLLLVLSVVALRAADASVEAVLRADNERLKTMMAGDGAALGQVLSDAMIFVHSDGRRESKADYLRNLMAGDTAYADARTSDLQAQRITADVVVLTGAQVMRKKLGADWSEINLRFQSVWRNESGTWRLVAWQSMRPAGNSVVPAKK
jgi:hypothetical protein